MNLVKPWTGFYCIILSTFEQVLKILQQIGFSNNYALKLLYYLPIYLQ